MARRTKLPKAFWSIISRCASQLCRDLLRRSSDEEAAERTTPATPPFETQLVAILSLAVVLICLIVTGATLWAIIEGAEPGDCLDYLGSILILLLGPIVHHYYRRSKNSDDSPDEEM